MLQNDDIRAALLAATGEKRSVAPRDVAMVLASESEDWRRLLPAIKREATVMADQGLLVFLRKKKIVDPRTVKGVFRYAGSHCLTSDGDG